VSEFLRHRHTVEQYGVYSLTRSLTHSVCQTRRVTAACPRECIHVEFGPLRLCPGPSPCACRPNLMRTSHPPCEAPPDRSSAPHATACTSVHQAICVMKSLSVCALRACCGFCVVPVRAQGIEHRAGVDRNCNDVRRQNLGEDR